MQQKFLCTHSKNKAIAVMTKLNKLLLQQSKGKLTCFDLHRVLNFNKSLSLKSNPSAINYINNKRQ